MIWGKEGMREGSNLNWPHQLQTQLYSSATTSTVYSVLVHSSLETESLWLKMLIFSQRYMACYYFLSPYHVYVLHYFSSEGCLRLLYREGGGWGSISRFKSKLFKLIYLIRGMYSVVMWTLEQLYTTLLGILELDLWQGHRSPQHCSEVWVSWRD